MFCGMRSAHAAPRRRHSAPARRGVRTSEHVRDAAPAPSARHHRPPGSNCACLEQYWTATSWPRLGHLQSDCVIGHYDEHPSITTRPAVERRMQATRKLITLAGDRLPIRSRTSAAVRSACRRLTSASSSVCRISEPRRRCLSADGKPVAAQPHKHPARAPSCCPPKTARGYAVYGHRLASLRHALAVPASVSSALRLQADPRQRCREISRTCLYRRAIAA